MTWKSPPSALQQTRSLSCLSGLNKKLERLGLAAEYNQIIRDQKEQAIIEDCPPESAGPEFYIPHKPVICKEAATTKLRVVYHAPDRAYSVATSLNECLYPSPMLQSKLWDVLVGQHFRPVAIFGDIQKAFLQIQIKEQEHDAIHFHWQINHSDIETHSFTCALLGLTCSPFLLGGVIKQLLQSWESKSSGNCCCTMQELVHGCLSEWWSVS